jgi:DNA-directed RNA polymerase subunit M/transcription elongation factor TFIIS
MTCPKCHNENVIFELSGRSLDDVLILWRCLECGHKWTEFVKMDDLLITG